MIELAGRYLSDPGLGAGFMRGVGSLEWQRLANSQASNKVVMVTSTPITLQFFGNILAIFVQVLVMCHTAVDRALTRSMTFCHFWDLLPPDEVFSFMAGRISGSLISGP